MGFLKTDLLADVVTSYDQTKTTALGRVSQKTIGGLPSLGPSVPCWGDIITDSTVAPVGMVHESKNIVGDNVRVFALGTPIAGSVQLIMYSKNIKTGVFTYGGRVVIQNPAILTTTVFRGLDVADTGTTNWKAYISMTNTITINGGLLLVNKLDLADFTPLGTITIPVPTGNDLKANYLLQDPGNIGVNQLHIASAGQVVHTSASRVYVHNGVAATHQYYVYDTSIAPTFLESTITGTNANPGVFTLTAHGFNNNDPVLFKTTGTFTGLVTNTVYFVRNTAANTFELSATSGGASISTTGTQSGVHSIGRAFGTTGSNFIFKTGNLPALTGTLLILGYESYAIPAHASYGALVGQDCAAFGTSSALYMGKLSDLSSGSSAWASLATANLLGTVNEVTTPASVAVQFSNVLDMFVFISGLIYYGKRLVNNELQFRGGGTDTQFLAGTAPTYGSVRFRLLTVTGFTIGNGNATIMGSTAGQQGMMSLDMGSDYRFDRDYVITKVLNSPDAILKATQVVNQLRDNTTGYIVWYRSSGFGAAAGGWILLPNDGALDAYVVGAQVQFRIGFAVLGIQNQTAPQIADMNISLESNDAISDKWEYSQNNSSSGSPTRASFRLRYAYSASIPSTLRFKAYDLSGVLLVSHTITSNPTNFEYSTDNGSTWLPLGTIPNTVGTLIRYTFTSPPGVDVRPSLKDS